MAYNTRANSSKTSSEHGDTLSVAEAEMIRQGLEAKEKLLREQADAINQQAAELEKEKEKQRRFNVQGLEDVLLSFQAELRELRTLRDIPQQLDALNDRVNTLQNQNTYPKENSPFSPERTVPFSSTTPSTEPSPIRLKDVTDSIPNYDGQRIPVFQFCKICERALELIPRNHEQYLVKLILNKLQGHAYTAVEGSEYKTVQQLLRKLKQIFGPNKSLNQYKGELGNAYMRPNESIFDYVGRIKELKTAIIDCEIAQTSIIDDWTYANIERDVLESFINGLPSDLLLRIKIEGYTDLDDAFTKAVQITKTLETEAARRKSSFPNRPNSPGRQDAPTYNPRYTPNPSYPSTPPRSILQRPQGHQPFIRPLIPGQPGPNAPSPIICRYCKNSGHIIANCQKLAARNSNLYSGQSSSFNQPREQSQTQDINSGNASRAPISNGVRRDTETAGRPQHTVRFQDQVKETTARSAE